MSDGQGISVEAAISELMKENDIKTQANQIVEQAVRKYPELQSKKQEVYDAWIARLTNERKRVE